MDPIQTLAACNIQPSSTIADFGAGAGFVARAAASLVPHGQVFAIEINKDMVTRLTRDANDHHITNLHALWGDIEAKEGSKLADASADMIMCFNILFLLDDKAAVLQEAYRVLKPGGRIVVVDWVESFGGLGPQPYQIFNKEAAETILTKIGFKKLSDALPAGAHHYAILFEK